MNQTPPLPVEIAGNAESILFDVVAQPWIAPIMLAMLGVAVAFLTFKIIKRVFR